MEICTRAISFWTYQTTQEAKFQEMAQRTLEDKLSLVEKQLQRMTREVNVELNGMSGTCEQAFLARGHGLHTDTLSNDFIGFRDTVSGKNNKGDCQEGDCYCLVRNCQIVRFDVQIV